MGFVVKYCEECSRRLSSEDFASGAAVEVNNRSYCRNHVPAQLRQVVQAAQPTQPARTTTSARRRATGKIPSGRTTAISNRARPPAAPPGMTVVATEDGGRLYRTSSSEIPSLSDAPSGATRRRQFKSEQKSHAGLVVGGVIIVVLGILGVVVATVMGGGDDNTPNTVGNSDTDSDSGNQSNASTSNTRRNNTTDVATPDTARIRQQWTDELSRTREIFGRANDALDTAEAAEHLRDAWTRVETLLGRAPSARIDAESVARAEDLRSDIAEMLGSALWDAVRPKVKEEQDAYRLQAAYEVLRSIEAGERDDLVPSYVTEQPDLFPDFHDQLDFMLDECKAEWDAYSALNEHTQKFLENLPELKETLAEALRADGGFYNSMRMKSFLERAEGLLETYPEADPTVVPRGGTFVRDYERVTELYVRHLLETLDETTDRETQLVALQWVRESNTARWFLNDEQIAAIDRALAGMVIAGEAIEVIRADVAALDAQSDLNEIYRALRRLRLLAAVWPLMIEHGTELKQLLSEIETLARAHVKRLRDALPNGDAAHFRVMAYQYIVLLDDYDEFDERVDEMTEWFEEQARDDRAEAVALDGLVDAQLDYDANDWPYITWGFPLLWTVVDELATWIREDVDNRVFRPGTQEPTDEAAIVNKLLTRALRDIDRDVDMLLETRDNAAAAFIVLQRIRAIQRSNLIQAAQNPTQVAMLERHAEALAAFARDSGRRE